MVAKPRRAAKARKPSRPKWVPSFLAELANTSNVAAAARKAKVDPSTVYERRRKDAEFACEWQVALCEGYDNLEMETLFRLRSGEIKGSTAKRGVRQYDNALALRLLQAHRDSTARTRALRDNVSAEEIRASLDRKVAEIRERVLAARAPLALPEPRSDAE